MASKSYEIGAAFERRVKQHMEDEGWYVTKSAGSKSITDLMGVKKGETPIGIQCRIGGKITKREEKLLNTLGAKYGFIPLVVRKLPDHSMEFRRLRGIDDET